MRAKKMRVKKMTNDNLKAEMGEKRYNKACERLNESLTENLTERWVGGKKVQFKRSIAEKLDYKHKTEKPKSIFIMGRSKK